jgi:uncharacterized phage-associated protein
MPHSAKSVANFFLARAREEEIAIFPMKLQKLVYYAHGWHLAFKKTPLINEQVECWQYGPVIPSLFREFKEFGSSEITRKARIFKAADSEHPSPDGGFFRLVSPVVPKSDEDAYEIMNAVWEAYKDYSAARLSNMTHRAGEPWKIVFDRYEGSPPRGTDIPMETIRECFEEMLKDE